MVLKLENELLISISVVFGAIALTLACVGIGAPNWQTTSANTTNGQIYTSSTANFFYACYLNSVGSVLSCSQRSANSNILQYYDINARGNQSEWNLHLNTAAGFSIIGIIFIGFGTVANLFMFFADQAEWFLLIAPSFLFAACLFMLAGLAEGARVLQYNGYAASLYETAHLLTIFSFLVSTIVAGRLFDRPLTSQSTETIKRTN